MTIDASLAPIVASLRRAGLLPSQGEPAFTALTGGVASDIWRVDGGARPFAVKRALAKLRVAADWQAPISRNAAEAFWLSEAARVAPGLAPNVLLHDAEAGFIAMDYLDPEHHPVWKRQLAAGHADPGFAAAVGDLLGKIHAATAGRADIAARVNDDSVFRALRIEPYLEYTASRRPEAAKTLRALAKRTLHTHLALVHGDVSPKNILAGPQGPVLLDAECAWVGDPAFDLAFCLNHLLLKCVWKPAASAGFLASFDALAGAYRLHVGWEPALSLEVRAATLLPALTLARIDGKSPVEYIVDENDKARVRAFALRALAAKADKLGDVSAAWARDIAGVRGKA
jgi:aminoglycoside phosphotransferase (APT) family kinase protein